MSIFKTVFSIVIIPALYTIIGCTPFKILKTDNSIIDTKKAIFTGTGFAYQNDSTDTWDTIKTPEVKLVAQGSLISFISSKGKLVSGDVKTVEFDLKSPCMQAKMDALENYSFTNVYVGNYITGFLVGPIIGAIPAAIITSIPVTEKRAPILNTTMAADPVYKDCFLNQVNRTRRLKAWMGMIGGWSLAIAITSAILPLTLSAQ